MLPDSQYLLTKLHDLHRQIRDHLHTQLRTMHIDELSQATALQGGDTIYALDTKGEEILLPYCEAWGKEMPFILVAEGLQEGRERFGCGSDEEAEFILICDPIDGTRPLMYDKRSAWLLTGIAPNLGQAANLSHIEIAMQTELPTSKALYGDTLWATRGGDAQAYTENLLTNEKRPYQPHPSQATTIEGGYGMFSKFFIGSKGWLADLEERLIHEVLGPPGDGQPQTFDDQYISSGGQFYELMTGRDRFNADLRPLAHQQMFHGPSSRLCSHPYDVCTELIAREAGVIVTDASGAPLAAPLDVHYPMAWIAYANESIRRQLEPSLLRLLAEYV